MGQHRDWRSLTGRTPEVYDHRGNTRWIKRVKIFLGGLSYLFPPLFPFFDIILSLFSFNQIYTKYDIND